jgi:hypothetical protein
MPVLASDGIVPSRGAHWDSSSKIGARKYFHSRAERSRLDVTGVPDRKYLAVAQK